MATVSKANPRILRDKDGNETRCISPIDYVSLTSGFGYKDVTDEKKQGDEVAAPAVEGADVDPPAANASKATWVDFVVAHRGVERADAEQQTRDQLAETYGS